MPRIEVPRIIDDHDGKELPEDTPVTNISYMGQRYKLYLSDENQAKLFDFLHTFTKDAEPVFDVQQDRARKATAAKSVKDADVARNRKIRKWAIETGFKFENAKGEQVTLGERGRIPDAAVKGWEAAGKPDLVGSGE